MCRYRLPPIPSINLVRQPGSGGAGLEEVFSKATLAFGRQALPAETPSTTSIAYRRGTAAVRLTGRDGPWRLSRFLFNTQHVGG
jgi:hypothetical protein